MITGRLDIPSTTTVTYTGEGNAIEFVDGMTVNNRPNGDRVLLEIDAQHVVDGVLTIPDGITGIGDYAFENFSADKIVLPEGVTFIGTFSFRKSNVKEVTLPSTLQQMGESAFQSCKQLESITIPEGVKDIPEYSFAYCGSLSSAVLPKSLESIGGRAFIKCEALKELVLPESLQVIGFYALHWSGLEELSIPSACANFDISGCTYMKKVNLPAQLATLPMGCFQGLTSLESITLPESLTEIGSMAFAQCSSLTQLTIPAGVKTIGDRAFYASGLTDIVLPQSVERMGKYLFYACPNLERVEVKTTIALPEDFCSQCPKLQSVVLPDGLEEIGMTSFYGCTSLTTLNLPSSVKRLKYGAFASTGLKSLTLSPSIERIGEYCFSESYLESVDLSQANVTTLEKGTFSFCQSLKEATLPTSLTYLAEDNFYSCGALVSVTSPSPVPPVARLLSFDNNVKTQATLYVPDASLADYQQADVWKNFFAIKGLSSSGITTAETSGDAVVGIYDLSGRRLQQRSSGVNIVKMSNGKTRKYFKK